MKVAARPGHRDRRVFGRTSERSARLGRDEAAHSGRFLRPTRWRVPRTNGRTYLPIRGLAPERKWWWRFSQTESPVVVSMPAAMRSSRSMASIASFLRVVRRLAYVLAARPADRAWGQRAVCRIRMRPRTLKKQRLLRRPRVHTLRNGIGARVGVGEWGFLSLAARRKYRSNRAIGSLTGSVL